MYYWVSLLWFNAIIGKEFTASKSNGNGDDWIKSGKIYRETMKRTRKGKGTQRRKGVKATINSGIIKYSLPNWVHTRTHIQTNGHCECEVNSLNFQVFTKLAVSSLTPLLAENLR